MDSYLSFFREINYTYWGTKTLAIIFFFSMMIIFSLERENWKRIVLFWYTAIILFLLYTPVSAYIGKILWNGSVTYYSRVFSVLPIFFNIAYAFVLIIQNAKKAAKLIMVLVFCGVVFLYGDFFYNAPDMSIAQNMEKISPEVVEICDALSAESDVKLVAHPFISKQIRTYDATIHMPYGRIRGENELAGFTKIEGMNIEYVDYFLKFAGKKGCNFVALLKNETTKNSFHEMGIEPFVETNSFVVYEVKNVPRTKIVYNELHQEVEKIYLDKNGNEKEKKSGVAKEIIEYNDKGEKTKKISLDLDGNVVKEKEYD